MIIFFLFVVYISIDGHSIVTIHSSIVSGGEYAYSKTSTERHNTSVKNWAKLSKTRPVTPPGPIDRFQDVYKKIRPVAITSM